MDHELLILPSNNCRICSNHLDGSHLKAEIKITRVYNTPCQLNEKQAADIITDLIKGMAEFRDGTRMDFESMGDANYKLWTGFTRKEFEVMLDKLYFVKKSPKRSKRNALAMFWIKLKTDLSFSQIASLFGMEDPRTLGRQIVSDAFDSVSDNLFAYFVPSHLGVNHLTPEQAQAHNTVYSKVFFGDVTTTIWDGTYLYLVKSLNYSKSRKIWCVYKHRHLIKFMSIVLPDGYILDMLGPFYSDGKNNDANMLEEILLEVDEELISLEQLEEEGLQTILEWIKKGKQVAVVDRGFRNAEEKLKELGVEMKMPSCAAKGTQQHSVQEANLSRLATKVRWPVEAHHGRFKKWVFFTNVQPSAHIPRMKQALRILCAAINAFRPPLYNTTKETEYHQGVANTMLERSKITVNPVLQRVERGALSSRGRTWQMEVDEFPINSSQAWTLLSEFPTLTEEEIATLITCGTYQIEQAKHYTDEHINSQGGFEFFVHKSANDLIRARVQSRHKNATKYFVWVEFSKKAITGWYCQCKAGARMVGCCAHVATLVWYFAYARLSRYQTSRIDYWKSVVDCTGEPDSDEEAPEQD